MVCLSGDLRTGVVFVLSCAPFYHRDGHSDIFSFSKYHDIYTLNVSVVKTFVSEVFGIYHSFTNPCKINRF